MLSQITLNHALPLATKLAESGRHLQPVDDTPLQHILHTCLTHGLYIEGTDLGNLSLGEASQAILDSANLKDSSGSNEHNGVVSQYVAMSGQSVAQSLNHVRNVVLPDVKEVLALVDEYRAGLANLALTPYVIVQKMRNPLFSNTLLDELVERFADTPAREVPTRHLPTIEIGQVKELCRTGAEGFDTELAESLSANGDEGYRVVQAVLSGSIALEQAAADAVVGVHIACKALYDNPIEGAEMSLINYNTHIALMTEQSGRIVYQHLEGLRRRDRLGQLYIGGAVYNPDGPIEIMVDNVVYLRMLEEGLTPEAVMGNEMLKRSYSQAQLVEHVPILTETYNRELKLRDYRAQLETTNKLRDGIAKLMAQQILTRPEEDLPAPRASLQKRVVDFLDFTSPSAYQNMPILVRDMVCHVFYAHTDALMILRTMDELGELYTDLDPRELALLTTIKYVSYWVSKQIRVS